MSESSNGGQYHSEAMRALVKVVEVLAPLVLQGATHEELVRATGCSRGRVYRALKNLEAAEWVEQADKVWRVTPRLTLLADGVRRALADASQRWLGAGG